MTFDTVVISDLHLGAPNSRSDELLEFLECVRTPRLVVAGDLFEYPDLRKLRERDLRVLDALRIFARTGELILVKGNHDPDLHYWRAVLGLTPLSEVEVKVGEKKYLVCHGDLWDDSMQYPDWVIWVADQVYLTTQRIDPSHRLARQLKKRCKFMVGAIETLRRRATAHARERGAAGIILGHTHVVGSSHTDGVHYLNSGCWTENPSSFIGIHDGMAVGYHWEGAKSRMQASHEEFRTTRRLRTFDEAEMELQGY